MGDARLLGSALDKDVVVEPARLPLIPGMAAVKEAAKAAGELQGIPTSGASNADCASPRVSANDCS
jgi:homoserine kinase